MNKERMKEMDKELSKLAAEIEAEAPVSFADGGGFNCRHEWIPV